MKDKSFYSIIEKIVEKEDPYGILLVGSLSRMNELELEKVRDVDIFVITDKDQLERQVVDIEGLEFDITYMPIKLLDQAIEKRLSSIICVLSKSKILYKSEENTLNYYLKVIQSIYDEGPLNLNQLDINYERFKLTQSYLTLESRSEDSLNFKLLRGMFLRELVTSYFKLNNIWMPPDKRMLKSIEDDKLKYLIESNISSTNTDGLEKDIKCLEQALNYVLEPFGGKLDFWEKDNFPFDFL